MSKSSDLDWCVYENWQPCNCLRMPETNRFSGEPDAGKSACPVRRGESGSHRKVSPSLLLYRDIALILAGRRLDRNSKEGGTLSRKVAKSQRGVAIPRRRLLGISRASPWLLLGALLSRDRKGADTLNSPTAAPRGRSPKTL